MTATHKLTAGDIVAMTAGELRIHLAAYVDIHGMGTYPMAIAETIAARIDTEVADVVHDLWSDLELV